MGLMMSTWADIPASAGAPESELLFDSEAEFEDWVDEDIWRYFREANNFAMFTHSRLKTRKMLHLDFDLRLKHDFGMFDASCLDGLLTDLGQSKIPVLNLQSTTFDEEDYNVTGLPADEPPTPWMLYLATRIPQASQFIIPESGHWLQVDQGARAADHIMQHLVNLIW